MGSKRKRLIMPKIIATKEDWIKLGYKLFAEQGISGIVIENMAKKLKVNKSSFYWHFKTKKEFIDEIVSYWVSSDTVQIIEATDVQTSAKGKFDTLVKLAFKKEPYLDFIFFLKRYAKKDKKMQKLIDDIDHQRIAYTKNILLEMKFSKSDAQAKAVLFYKYLIGYHEMLRYKTQSPDYVKEVKKELKQFINY